MIKFFLIITFLLASTIVQGQESRRFPMEESSLLWKITGPNMESDSYLFGTMHLIKKEYFLFPRKLKKSKVGYTKGKLGRVKLSKIKNINII